MPCTVSSLRSTSLTYRRYLHHRTRMATKMKSMPDALTTIPILAVPDRAMLLEGNAVDAEVESKAVVVDDAEPAELLSVDTSVVEGDSVVALLAVRLTVFAGAVFVSVGAGVTLEEEEFEGCEGSLRTCEAEDWSTVELTVEVVMIEFRELVLADVPRELK